MPFDPSTYQTPAGYRPKESTGLIDGRPAVEVINEMRAAQGQAPMLERIPTPPATAPASPSIDPSAYAPASPYGSPQPDRIQRYNAIKQYQNTMADKFGDMLTPELYVALGKKAEQEYEMLYPEKYATQIQDIPGTASVLVLTPDGKSQIVAKEKQGIDIPLEEFKMKVAKEQRDLEEKSGAKLEENKKALESAADTFSLIERIKTHPALSGNIGAVRGQHWLPFATGSKEFMALLNQLKGKNFLTAIQQMRGMGALSNTEGEAATKAVSALDTGMSEEAFISELTRLQDVVKRGQDNALQKLKALGVSPDDVQPGASTQSGQQADQKETIFTHIPGTTTLNPVK